MHPILRTKKSHDRRVVSCSFLYVATVDSKHHFFEEEKIHDFMDISL